MPDRGFNSINEVQSRSSEEDTPTDFEDYIVTLDLKTKVTSYAPYLMKMIRATCGMEEGQIISSLLPEHNRIQIFKSNTSSTGKGGKSGSFFFLT